ncbi:MULTISPECIES: hypothetical protein [Salinivibrio]|nr:MULTISPECIES: hypothetical protein [Salinivibrio]
MAGAAVLTVMRWSESIEVMMPPQPSLAEQQNKQQMDDQSPKHTNFRAI